MGVGGTLCQRPIECPLPQRSCSIDARLVADNTTNSARDLFLDRYHFEGEARDAATDDLARLAAVMLRIASRIAREQATTDSPE